MPRNEGLGVILVTLLIVWAILTNITHVLTKEELKEELKEVSDRLDKLESEYNDSIDIVKPAVIDEVPSDGEM